MIEFRAAKVNHEKWQPVLERKHLLAKVLLCLVHCLHLVAALRKTYQPIERFLLDVEEVNDEFHGLEGPSVVTGYLVVNCLD